MTFFHSYLWKLHSCRSSHEKRSSQLTHNTVRLSKKRLAEGCLHLEACLHVDVQARANMDVVQRLLNGNMPQLVSTA